MRYPRFAESLLTLTMEPPKAAAAVGDLLEETSGETTPRFWRQVGSLWMGQWARSVREHAREIAVNGALAYLLALVVGFGRLGLAGVASHFHLFGFHELVDRVSRGWAAAIYLLIFSCLLGLWLARRCKGFELAAVGVVYMVTCLVTDPLIGSGVYLIHFGGSASALSILLPRLLRLDLLCLAPCLLSASLVRRRRLRNLPRHAS